MQRVRRLLPPAADVYADAGELARGGVSLEEFVAALAREYGASADRIRAMYPAIAEPWETMAGRPNRGSQIVR
jgi:hypothetical protein